MKSNRQSVSGSGGAVVSPSAPPVTVCKCGCGKPIENRRSDAKFYDKSCRDRYREKSRTRVLTRPFVAIDGEGVQSDYNLLAANGHPWIGRKPGRLTTEECLDYLLNLPRGSENGRKPIYVWFSFDYDINMILQDIPFRGEKGSIEALRRENSITWRGYRITYLRRKILRIARGKRRHTSYDIWGFFQATFEQSLEDWKVPLPDIITKGKKARGNFSRWSLKRIVEYNQAELEALSELGEKLRDSILPLDLPIQSWHGPAALAASWLRKNGTKKWLPIEEYHPDFSDVTKRAYFGGRIDVAGYGIIDPVFHYDIVSAYPSATRNIPNLRNLKWKCTREGLPAGGIYCARIRWQIPEQYWSPFPWRSSNGSIRYPLEGEGWYWNWEVEAALEKYGESNFEIVEVWYAEGNIEYPFRNLIEETFQYRHELKAQNHPSHIPVKLILNSLYGKFAQTVGKATYYSPIWAGLITSETRAKLMRVLDENVVCVMTDSVWSKKTLRVPIGKNLGDWEYQPDRKLILAEAGLYQSIQADGTRGTWQRGFDRRNPVDIEKLVNLWLWDDPTYQPVYNVNRFIGMGLASMTSYPWCNWIDLERKIAPVPLVGTTKRLPLFPLDRAMKRKDFIYLDLRPRDTKEVSYPYKKLTEDEDLIRQRLEDECEEE